MKKFVTVLFLALITMVLAFQPNVNLLSYKSITYRVTIEGKTALTTLQIEKGKEGYDITYIVKFTVQEDFEYNVFALPYIYLMFSYIYNPGFLPFFQMIDIDNPTTVNIYGMKIVYEKDEKVGKYVGKRFSFYTNDQKLFSFVASKQVELVLKLEIPDQKYVAELVDFRK
ncbi:hypothetical protein [Pseudothermotoga sp.]|uniref:hypothetical protein n=1 Tax=Pseudothermotoga sp. TaxID=2033661 RepID=UPI0031F61340